MQLALYLLKQDKAFTPIVSWMHCVNWWMGYSIAADATISLMRRCVPSASMRA